MPGRSLSRARLEELFRGVETLFEDPSDAPCWHRPDLFFPPDRAEGEEPESEDEHALRVDAAKELCFTPCPKQQECLNGAVIRREPVGIWGGLEFPDEYERWHNFAEGVAAGDELPGDPELDEALAALSEVRQG